MAVAETAGKPCAVAKRDLAGCFREAAGSLCSNGDAFIRPEKDRPSEGAVRRALHGWPDGLLCGERGNGHARQHGRDGDCPRTTATGRASGWHNREREAGSLKYNPLRPGGHVLSPTILDSP